MNDTTHPLSFKSFFHEIRQEFGSPDRGFLRTATHGLAAPPSRLAFLRDIGWWLLLQLISGAVVGVPLAKTVYDLNQHPAHHEPASASTASS